MWSMTAGLLIAAQFVLLVAAKTGQLSALF